MTRPVQRATSTTRTRTSGLDVDRTARAIAGGASLLDYPELGMRQGQVVAVDVPNSTVDITLGGDPTVIPGVKHNSNYRPAVNDVIWVFSLGNDLLVFDRVGAFGPSVIDTVAAGTVAAAQSRTSTSYGDLSTVGPSVTVSVSPSGRVLVQVSAWVEALVDGSSAVGGAMGIGATGANTLSAADDEALVVFLDIVCAVAVGGNTSIGASQVSLITGLNPGVTTFTAKYRALVSGETVSFYNRRLWALPL